MAELKGPILFSGSIGGIRAYYDRVLKRYFVSGKGGSNKELIKHHPAMARQRENMNEFKACAKWASQLRRSMTDILHLCEGYYFSEMMSLAKLIQKQDDVGVKGYRIIASSRFSKLLSGFNFNKIHPFDRVFAQQYEVLFSDDKRTVTLRLPGFRSGMRINWPEKFESYRIALVITQQPDWAWSKNDERYLPVVYNLGFLSTTALSEWRAPGLVAEDFVLQASFAQPALQQPGTTVVVAVGIEVSPFPLQGTMIKISGKGTMKIVECFV